MQNKRRLNGHGSTTTALLQKPPSKARAVPATQPAPARSKFSLFGSSLRNPLNPVTITNPPREAISATRPAAIEAAAADETASRQAIFETGRSTVKTHAYSVQTG